MRPLVLISVLPAIAAVSLPNLAAQRNSTARIVAEAVSPLPKQLRDGATVMQFQEDGTLTQIREGTGQMICLSDDPRAQGFHPACYHKDLGPYMARGRELRAQGKNGNESRSIRFDEIKAGKLAWPKHAVALYSLTGPDGSFDPTTGEAPTARGLQVIYVPYATEETSGVSTTPARDRPWLMHAGTPGAHVMIAIPPKGGRH
ncbi:MAG: hypothetical protein ACE5HT_02850 [Gemmatimonadales bacterium]